VVKKTLSRAASGAFVRNPGWNLTGTGCSRRKFRLGGDEAKATLANLRSEQLRAEATI
jgi:hypothetical protein